MSRTGLFGDAVIAGNAQTPYLKKTELPTRWFVVESIVRALEHAGIAREEVDGLAVTSFELAPDNVSTISQDLGLETSWAFQGAYGGASAVISVMEAARAVRDGLASVVVCAAGDAFTVESHMDMVSRFTGSIRDYLSPYGFGGANGLFALVQRKHMHEYGTRVEQLGRIAVTQRGHAVLNPNAVFREAISLDDYLASRMIADPIRLYDCVLPCAGGDAVVVTNRERALDGPNIPVEVVAGGQQHNFDHSEVTPTTQGWVRFADRMFSDAGLSRDEIDLVEVYDDYPIMALIQLEDLGFVEKGDGGTFLEKTDLSIRGELPLNTGGGQLSAGQAGASGGMIGVTEAVAQLQGHAGERQVPNAAIGLVSGFGMVGYGRGLSCSAMLLHANGG